MFTFNTSKAAVPEVPVTDILDGIQDVVDSYAALNEADKQLKAVVDAMENIQMAKKAVETYGLTKDLVGVMNYDGGLEDLGLAVNKLTKETFIASLEAQDEGLLKKFWEGVKKVCRVVIAFIKSILGKGKSVWDGQKLADLKKLVEDSDYNNLWAASMKDMPTFDDDEKTGWEQIYTKQGIANVVELYSDIVPKYLEYGNKVAMLSFNASEANIESKLAAIKDLRQKFVDFLASTKLGGKFPDGKPIVSTAIDAKLSSYKLKSEFGSMKDLGWKSKNDVLATIADLEKLQKLKDKVADLIPIVSKIEQSSDKYEKANPFTHLRDIADTTRAMVIDSARVMQHMTKVYAQMVRQMQHLVTHFYKAASKKEAGK